MEDISLIEEEVQEILLHRDAHFAGQFPVMLDYYATGGKGVYFESSQVESVLQMERAAGENLAPLLFSEGEMKTIAKVRSLYEGLRELCEQDDPKNPNPRLLAELILAEEDEESDALQGVIERGEQIVPDLIKLATHEEFSSPLYPGYGRAPIVAIQALQAIGDKRALLPLFELIGDDEGEVEGAALSALATMHEAAEPLFLNILEARPVTQDTERAAIALTTFPKSPAIQEAAARLLKEERLPQVLTQYLQILLG